MASNEGSKMAGIYAFGTFTNGQDAPWPGLICEGKVAALSAVLPDAPKNLAAVFENWEDWSEKIDKALKASRELIWFDESEVVAKLPYKPENLFGAGANYRQHVIELIVDRTFDETSSLSAEERYSFGAKMMDERAATGKPFLWVGLRSAIAGPSKPLLVPFDMVEVDWELELGIVIGRKARRVKREHALDHVAGYLIANDITARELVERKDARAFGMDLLASKSAPGFHILGPYITPARFVADPQQLHIQLSLNGEVMQDEGTDDMIFDVARLIEYTSAYVQLYPGDIIMTGSPSGNGTHYNRFLRDGDVMIGKIDGIVGEQVVRCIAEQNPY